MRNFWFSYKNILKKEILEKNHFTFFRRIFGALYKFLIRFFRHQFSINCSNLDKLNKKDFINVKLDDLFIKFNCDKGTYFHVRKEKILAHNYSIFYEKYFINFKNKKINLLELGSHEGKGIASFYFYFPNAEFIGANINPFQMRFYSKRITELFVDVSSKKILTALSKHLVCEPEIIIDDASHNLRDILITFSIFFKKLKSGGIYVIEDINQFEVFNELNPYGNELTPLEILKRINSNEKFKSSFIDEESKDFLIKNIDKIKFEKGSMIIKEKNVSDIAFIFKK